MNNPTGWEVVARAGGRMAMRVQRGAMTVWILVMVVAGCSSLAVNRPGDDPDRRAASYVAFVDSRLAPYLLEQLGGHPRFRDQAVILAAARGSKITGRIDELTRWTRNRLRDALDGSPGIRFVNTNALAAAPFYPAPSTGSCRAMESPHYAVMLELTVEHESGRARLQVKAVDLADGTRVPGFHLAWQGKLSQKEKKMAVAESPDEELRGRRVLPFTGKQIESLAAFLAHLAACTLLNCPKERMNLFLQWNTQGIGDLTAKIHSEVAWNLNALERIEMTAENRRADSVVQIKVTRLKNHLYRFRIKTAIKEGAGAWTETACPQKVYAILEPGNNRKSREQTQLERSSRTRVAEAEQGAAFLCPSSRSPASVPELLGESTPAGPAAPHVQLRVVTPAAAALCLTATPWLLGERSVRSGENLPSGSCLAVRLRLDRPAYLYVLSGNVRGELVRLFPSRCDGRGAERYRVPAAKAFELPVTSSGALSVLDLVGRPGKETIHAVAITDQAAAARLEELIRDIPDTCAHRLRAAPQASDITAIHWHEVHRFCEKVKDRCGYRTFTFIHRAPLMGPPI